MNPFSPNSNDPPEDMKLPPPRGAGVTEAEDEKSSDQRGAAMIVAPQPNDVILGRGFRFAWHSGNNEFQALIRHNIPRYNAAKRKNDKSRVVQGIYDTVSRKGRFLKKDEATGLYFVVEEEHVAKEKISQAIRYQRRRSGRSSEGGSSPSPTKPGSPESIPSPGRTRQPQAELFDDPTLLGVLGPEEEVSWPSLSQFAVLASFDTPLDFSRYHYPSHPSDDQDSPSHRFTFTGW